MVITLMICVTIWSKNSNLFNIEIEVHRSLLYDIITTTIEAVQFNMMVILYVFFS